MGSCEGYRADTEYLKHDERWHDYFKSEFGYEVVNISMSGCTVQQQVLAVYAYFQDNPGAHFDLAIVEGRGMEGTVSEPMHFIGGPPYDILNHPAEDLYEFKLYYEKWLDSAVDRVNYSPITALPPDHSYDYQKRYMAWYIEYVYSMNHAVDTWSANVTLCDYISRYSDIVKWFSWSYSQDDVTDLKLQIGKDLLSEYVIDWPMLNDIEDIGTYDVSCDCGHFNPEGHKMVWEQIKDKLERSNIL
jgi:hypothetical protein